MREVPTVRRLRDALETAIAMQRVQAETARNYAKAGRDTDANLGLAVELDRHATVWQQVLNETA